MSEVASPEKPLPEAVYEEAKKIEELAQRYNKQKSEADLLLRHLQQTTDELKAAKANFDSLYYEVISYTDNLHNTVALKNQMKDVNKEVSTINAPST